MTALFGSRSWRDCALAASVLCLGVGLLDCLHAFLRSPSTDLLWLASRAPVTSLALLLAHAAILLPLSRLVGPSRMRDAAICSALAVGLLAAYAIAVGPASVRDDMPVLVLYTGLVLFAAAWLYVGLPQLEGRPRAAALLRSGALSLPLLAAATVALAGALAAGLGEQTPAARIGVAAFAVIAMPALAVAVARLSDGSVLRIAGGLWLLVLLLPALARLAAPADGIDDERRSAATPIVLITVDTLRADAVSCDASPSSPTPRLGGLCRESVVFERAYSGGSWTLPGIASLLTGTSSLVHGVTTQESVLPDRLDTLAEILGAAGYRSRAIVSSWPLARARNMDQGFVEYDRYPERNENSLGQALLEKILPAVFPRDGTPKELTDLALAHLRRQRDPRFLLWVHYFDPHLPYEPPPEFLAGIETGGIGARFHGLKDVRMGHFAPGADERRSIRELYAAEVRYVDREIGRLLDGLREVGLYDRALIVLTSDHGEEFWEHGGFEHGQSFYDELLRVPLMIKLPGASEGRQVGTRVSTDRLLATVLDVAGAGEPPPHAGPSLRPLWRDGPGAADPIRLATTGSLYFEKQIALVHDHYKYVRAIESGREEIYDLLRDPGETRPLPPEGPLRAELRARLAEAIEEAARVRSRLGLDEADPSRPLAKPVAEQLRALGYIP